MPKAKPTTTHSPAPAPIQEAPALPIVLCQGEVKAIPGSEYIVLPNKTVARLNKPTALFNNLYFNIWLSGRYCRINANDLDAVAAGQLDPRSKGRRKKKDDPNQGR